MGNNILDNDLEQLKSEILKMSALVEKAIYVSMESLMEDKVDTAQQVIQDDDNIDTLYQDVQKKCMRLLALRHPLAVDLRTVQAEMQIATDLERMGDRAEKIAKSTLQLHGKRTIADLSSMSLLTAAVMEMLSIIVNSYAKADVESARNIVILEDKIDGLYKNYFNSLMEIIEGDGAKAYMAVQLLFAIYCLERIADHATNIGESVIYMATGERVRLND